MKVKLLTIPRISAILTSGDYYERESMYAKSAIIDGIISAISPLYVNLIGSNILDDFNEVTVKEYDALMRWIALNNRVEHNDQYVLVVDAINSNTTKEKFDSLLATAVTEIAKIDAKDAKEREIREARRLKTLAAAEKKRIKKEKEEEKLMKEKQQAELEQGLSAISNEIGTAITLDDIKTLVKTRL